MSDLHGSGKCFRKFLNGGPIYDADVMVLGGDVAGKAIQAITRTAGGRYQFSFRGAAYDLPDGEELRGVEQLISDHGYYPYRADPGELAEREAAGTLDDLFLTLITRAASAVAGAGRRAAQAQGHADLLDAWQRRPARAGGLARRRTMGDALRGPRRAGRAATR